MHPGLPALLALLCAIQDPTPAPTPIPAAELPALFDQLDRNFAALGRFRAEYEVTGIPFGEDGPDMARIILHADLAPRQAAFQMLAKGDKEPSMTSQFDGFSGWVWRHGDPEARRLDGDILMRMLKTTAGMATGADRLLGRAEERVFHGQVNIRIDGKPAKDKMGSIRFAMGTTWGRHASWIHELEVAKDAVIRRAGNRIEAELPSARKLMAVDADTGMLRSLSVRDYDNTVRAIALAALAKDEAAPALSRPATVKSSLIPADELAGQADDLCSGEWCGIPDLAKAWERLDAEKKAGDAKVLLSGFYRDILHLWFDHALQSFARQYLAGRIARGATPDSLKQDADLEFERFGAAITEPGASRQLIDFVKNRSDRFQGALLKSLEASLADAKDRKALILRTMEATFGDPSIDTGDKLILRARQAFNVVLAHPEEL